MRDDTRIPDTPAAPGMEEALLGAPAPAPETLQEMKQAITQPIHAGYTHAGSINRPEGEGTFTPASVFLLDGGGPLCHGKEAKIMVIDNNNNQVFFIEEMEDMSMENISAKLWGNWAGEQGDLENRFRPLESDSKPTEAATLTLEIKENLSPILRAFNSGAERHFCEDPSCKPCSELYLDLIKFIGMRIPTVQSATEALMTYLVSKEMLPSGAQWYQIPINVYTEEFIIEFVLFTRSFTANPNKGEGAEKSELVFPTLTHQGCTISDCQTCLAEHTALEKYFIVKTDKTDINHMDGYEKYLLMIDKVAITPHGWGTKSAFNETNITLYIKFVKSSKYVFNENNEWVEVDKEGNEILEVLDQSDQIFRDDENLSPNSFIIPIISIRHAPRCSNAGCIVCLTDDSALREMIIEMLYHYDAENRYSLDRIMPDTYEVEDMWILYDTWYARQHSRTLRFPAPRNYIRPSAFSVAIVQEFRTYLEEYGIDALI